MVERMSYTRFSNTSLTAHPSRRYSLFQIREFINNTYEDRPCIVYGASGCGKTSVLAKAANEVRLSTLNATVVCSNA